MLRDADLRDNENDTMQRHQHQHQQQYDAPPSHHRQPHSSQSQSQSQQREYHYSRRRRDDTGGPSPPSSSQSHTYAPAPTQAQAQAQAPYSYTRATSSSPPPAPRLQQASSSSSGSHVHYQPHPQQQQPPPPQLYHPTSYSRDRDRDRERDRYRDRDLDRDLVSPLSSSPSPARSRTGTPVPLPVPSPFDPTPALSSGDSNLSLAVNYIPSKFSNPRLSALTTSSAGIGGAGDRDSGPGPGGYGPRRRRTGSRRPENELGPGVPKMGGGVDAFRSGEARIGGSGDEDEDGDDDGDGEEADEGGGGRGSGRGRRGWFAYSRSRTGSRGIGAHAKPRKARWNGFKWCLFIANLALTLYSFTALIFCLLTWFNVWAHADVIRAGNHAELVLSTLAATTGILTCLIGWVGILMNNRSFLAVYTFLLWIVFMFVLIPGYLTYRRRTFNLEGKINAQWSKALGEAGRLRIQNQLQCCGYFSPFVEATISQTCYARATLPGCKSRYLAFERRVLEVWYEVAFGLVPLHIGVIVAGLLCANHVTYRFGKGMMPKAYRLSAASMAVIMDNYATQLAERYGADVAQDVLTRSRSNLNLLLPTLPSLPAAPSTTSLKTDKAVAGSVVEYEAVAPSLGWRDRERERGGDRERERMGEREKGRPPILRRGEEGASGSGSGSGSGTSREGENAPLI